MATDAQITSHSSTWLSGYPDGGWSDKALGDDAGDRPRWCGEVGEIEGGWVGGWH